MVDVKQQSSVDAQAQPFLHGWDSAARQYHSFFEIRKQVASDNLLRLRQNPFTSWRGLIQQKSRYQELDTLQARQQLGEIASHEVSDVNSAISGRYLFSKCSDEPAKLFAYDKLMLGFYFGAGQAIGAWGFFVKRYNMLWLAAGFVPAVTAYILNAGRQPTEELQNAYRFILEKRAASAVYEKSAQSMHQSVPELAQVKEMLSGKQTLYDLENDLVDSIAKGSF